MSSSISKFVCSSLSGFQNQLKTVGPSSQASRSGCHHRHLFLTFWYFVITIIYKVLFLVSFISHPFFSTKKENKLQKLLYIGTKSRKGQSKSKTQQLVKLYRSSFSVRWALNASNDSQFLGVKYPICHNHSITLKSTSKTHEAWSQLFL